MYMSYCRYEGTKAELESFIADVWEHINREAEYEDTDREITCFKDMVIMFHEFLQEADLLEDDGDLNHDELDRVCEAMSHGYEKEDW